MPQRQPGKLLRLHLSEDDQYEGRSLCEAIVDKCQQLGVAGLTVFRGLEGYGQSAELRRAHLLGRHQPLVIHIVESADTVRRILPEFEQMLGSGMIAVSDVEVIRIENGASAPEHQTQNC